MPHVPTPLEVWIPSHRDSLFLRREYFLALSQRLSIVSFGYRDTINCLQNRRLSTLTKESDDTDLLEYYVLIEDDPECWPLGASTTELDGAHLGNDVDISFPCVVDEEAESPAFLSPTPAGHSRLVRSKSLNVQNAADPNSVNSEDIQADRAVIWASDNQLDNCNLDKPAHRIVLRPAAVQRYVSSSGRYLENGIRLHLQFDPSGRHVGCSSARQLSRHIQGDLACPKRSSPQNYFVSVYPGILRELQI